MNGGVKYGVAAVLLGLWAAISAWIVAGEGKAYREAIARKQPNPAPGPDEAPIREPEPPPQPATVTVPTPVPRPSPPPVVAVASPPSPPAAPADRAPAAPAKKAEGRKLDPFWNEPDQAKVWDFDKFTAADERELGQALRRMVLHDHAEIIAGPLPRRLKAAAKPYEQAVTRSNVKYTYTVLDCPRMNVFSHPGGYIYVCRGLFDWIAEDEDYALGFILAHEIAHVDKGHAINCLRDPKVKEFKFGSSFLFYAVMIPAGYQEEQDLEADRWAALQMLRAGRTRYETLAFLRRLEDYAKLYGFENQRLMPNAPPPVTALDNHIRAHPIPSDRLDALKVLIDSKK